MPLPGATSTAMVTKTCSSAALPIGPTGSTSLHTGRSPIDCCAISPTAGSNRLQMRRSHGAVFLDLDNDGMLDLFVTNNTRSSTRLPPGVQREAQFRRSALYRNDRGTFVDVSAVSGGCLTLPGSARGIGVLDYDADG